MYFTLLSFCFLGVGVLTVTDKLCPGLYDSSYFVRISDNFSYKAKKSKENFGKGINNCVFQETVEDIFTPNQMIICDSLYGFTSANIHDNNSTNESWLFVIFVKRNIYDSFFKIPYSGYEPADCLPHQVIDCLISLKFEFLNKTQPEEV